MTKYIQCHLLEYISNLTCEADSSHSEQSTTFRQAVVMTLCMCVHKLDVFQLNQEEMKRCLALLCRPTLAGPNEPFCLV